MLIIKIPGINSMGKTNGTRNAGNAIIENLKDIKSNEKGKIIDVKLLNIEEIHVNNSNLEEQDFLIHENCRKIFESEDKIVFLGGDHSISFSIGKAFLDFCRENDKEACLIVFDSHADCCKDGKEPTHEEWLRGLIEYGFPAEGVLLVGARNLCKEEIEFISKKKIKRISIDELNNNLDEITDVIMEFAFGKELYVSFDIDIIDMAFAPSTSYPETGGLTSRQAIHAVSRISRMKNLKAFDIVEVDSEKDKERGNMTVKLAAKLVGELL